MSEHGRFNQVNDEVEAKINNLLSKMTLSEKVGQMVQRGSTKENTKARDIELIKQGKIGSFLNTGGTDDVNELQRAAVEHSRLGIPLIIGFDVIHGFKTIFPIPLAQASSWDMESIEESEAIAAKEAEEEGIRWAFAPMVDVCREPRWGRIAEGSGEDTFLGSQIAKARIRGFQRLNREGYPTVVACPKHFAGYGAAEGGRDYNSCEIGERNLREIYLQPFKAAVDEGAGTIMSAFHEISGVPCSGSDFLLHDILADEWKFRGFVISDWGSVMELEMHGTAADQEEAAIQAVTAGVHMDMHENTYNHHLQKLVEEGKIPVAVIDSAVRRILRVKFQLGLFEKPYTDEKDPDIEYVRKAHCDAARDLSRRSIVLLKNEKNILPISKDVKDIAVIGPLADYDDAMMGCWPAWRKYENMVTVLQGIKNIAGTDTRLHYAKGCSITGTNTDGINEAVSIAKKCDIAIMVLGEDSPMSGENHNRAFLDLPGQQQKLLEAVHATGTDVVLVLGNGRPLTIPWAKENIPAIVEGWHLGIQAGNAIADVLFGDYNPSGKLPVTFPSAVGQVPLYYNHKNTGRPGWERYCDWDDQPLFPFGYGLSYSDFQYSDLCLSQKTLDMSGIIEVSVNVSNVSDTDGEEIVQLYIQDITGSVTRPVKELKGFQKVLIKAGACKDVTFSIDAELLRFYDKNMKFTAEKGMFNVWVGPNSQEGLADSFALV